MKEGRKKEGGRKRFIAPDENLRSQQSFADTACLLHTLHTLQRLVIKSYAILEPPTPPHRLLRGGGVLFGFIAGSIGTEPVFVDLSLPLFSILPLLSYFLPVSFSSSLLILSHSLTGLSTLSLPSLLFRYTFVE